MIALYFRGPDYIRQGVRDAGDGKVWEDDFHEIVGRLSPPFTRQDIVCLPDVYVVHYDIAFAGGEKGLYFLMPFFFLQIREKGE